MRRKIEQAWRSLAIRQKILLFTGSVLLIILMTGILDAWVVHFSMVDFYRIMEDNAKNIELVRALERESAAFQSYVNNPDKEKQQNFELAEAQTAQAVQQLPFDYQTLGKELYAQTWSIRNSYEVYVGRRGEILQMDEKEPTYIACLYRVYDMQSYLLDYADSLMIESMEAGNNVYQARYFWIFAIPIAVFLLILVLFFVVIKLAGVMNQSITEPVMELANASRRIAANDFYVDDVQVENQDELGELVAAFNKMKYATRQYIQTQEEKRKALDELHEKEVESLEMQRRLERAKMELLMSQINPHFLFNTLNVIGGMANLEEANITEKMIKSLSDLFRYSLKNDQAVVPLSRELKIVEDYMYLQHMRFGARIAYQINCDVDTESVLLPTFTFQPLVENAIIHGLTPKVEGGRIVIDIHRAEDVLSISIADNGMGMSEETRERLQEEVRKSEITSEGIGFANVTRRIYAMYPEAQVELIAKENEGTTVKIQIPVKGEQDVSGTGCG